MSKVIYVEPDEEITDLVERIRGSGGEGDLVFVLPNRARVLQSPLNLRLLQQYSRSFVKRTAIVSGDPRVQALSREVGFPTFASVQAYERGVEVMRPLPPDDMVSARVDEDGDGGGAAVAVASPPALATTATRTATRPTPGTVMPPPHGPSRRRLYAVAGALFAVGLLLIFLVAPSATVKITLTANAVKVSRLIQGTTDPTAAAGPDHILTQAVTADETQGFQAKPTGTKQIVAAPAAGSVVLTTDLGPRGACITGIRKGQTSFTTGGSNPTVFLANADVNDSTQPADQKPHCDGLFVPPPQGGSQYGAPSDPVPVVAQVAGAGGNVPAGAINNWPSNPCNATPAPNQVQTCSSADLRVGNPQATSGGVDTHNVTVASADDVKQFQSQVDTLKKQLTDKVKQDMQGKAPGSIFAVDPSGQGLTVATDIQPALPNPDDQYQATNINVNAHGRAAMYNPKDVKKVINDDLLSLVPKNQQVATNPPPDTHDLAITQAGDDGTVIFNATETAFTQPVVDLSSLKDRFAGKTRSSVQQSVEQQFPGAQPTAEVSQSIPFFVLPFFSSRIEIFISVHPPASTPAT